ncbi:hypothetical protein FJR38_11655 [Anabaena sp. UHCC 0253]|uniref:Ycf66 family protein n=1 Tax=Anabaena sp. UHCC 0253 TaxID=2590019 RepID=UPI0014456F38|nr:Ycf66 family protein [Anabaena sp. UHCC 0253]MTJ53252.1 hypothetical protein [Anabaena sp. UHCC 0253]
MLAYLLSLVVGFGSLAIYLSAFFFPEIHRKNDFIWSGVGLFYALVLWIFAPRITGGLLLGHVASVALLVWFGWQTLSLRRQLAPEVQQTPIPSPELIKVSLQEQIAKFSVKEKWGQLAGLIGGVFSGAKAKVEQTVTKKPVTTTEVAPPSTLADGLVTVISVNETEGLSEETLSPSPDLEMVEVAPTSPPVIEEEEKQVIPPTETPVAGETENVVEVTQTEICVSETPVAGETEMVVEVTQTQVVVVEETNESAAEVISPNPVTSELLATEAAEKSDLTVEEVKPDGEASPEQIPLDKPGGE